MDVFCLLKRFFFWVVDQIGYIIDFLFGWIFNILPDSPFEFEKVEWGPFARLIGTFIPVEKMAIHLTYILSACAIYFGIRYILRLIKMVK